MPLSVQGHHALMDGVHAGRFFEQAQRYLDAPAALFDGG
jgi:chloramphenicol O-acetyltransferase type A